MSSRKVKSILFGSAEDTRILHREHRSKGGRKKYRALEQKSPRLVKNLEKIKKYEEKNNLG